MNVDVGGDCERAARGKKEHAPIFPCLWFLTVNLSQFTQTFHEHQSIQGESSGALGSVCILTWYVPHK